MFSCFYFICLALCDETSTKVCLYSTNLPDACKNIISFDVSKVEDIDSEIESIKANKMILLFAPTIYNQKTDTKIDYKLKISTFSKISVNFTSLNNNGDKFSLQLTIDQFEPTNSIVLFEDCSLHFIGKSSSVSLQFDWIELTRCDVSFENIADKITAQAAIFDSAFQYFSEIKIEGGHRNPDFTINTTEDLYVELKNYENVINNKIHVIYTNNDYRDIEIIGSKNLSFLCSTSDINKLSTVILQNIEILNIIDSNIEFPEEYIMKCENIHNIHGDETTIPVSLFKPTNKLFDFTNIYCSHYVDISGDIECDIAFIKEQTFDDFYDRIGVNIRGSVSSNLISINSSCFDIEITDLKIDMNKYMGSDPIIHCIGKGGVSSFTAFTDYTGIVGFSRPLFNRDFDTFLSDEDLNDFLDVELNYLMLSSNSNDFESYAEPSISFVNEEKFIHGFSKDDSVANIFRTTVNPLVDTIVISSPSSKTLKLCYETECKGGIKIGKEDLKDLSKSYVFEGMKNVLIETTQKIELIDFSKLFENLNISVQSTSVDKVQIDSAIFNENLQINCTFKNVKLPSLSIKLTNVTFCNCTFISDDKKIKTTKETNVQIDSDFLLNDYLNSHFEKNCEIDHLSIQIDTFSEIHFTENGFHFIGPKSEDYSISQSTIKWNSIEFKKDVFKSDSLTLFANSNNPSFDLLIQTSKNKKNDEVFTLKLQNWSLIKDKKPINFDHSMIPIQIFMTEPIYIDPIVLTGKGKVIYSHEYSSSTTICACEDKEKIDKFPNCKKSDNIVIFSKLNEELKSTQFDDITVIVAGSSKDGAKHPTIDMESINMKIVNFTAENENSDTKGFITISNEKQLNDPQLTETYFNNFEIYSKSGTQSNEYVFGELSFIYSNLNNFDKSTLKVNYFTCDTILLNLFNDVYITDNLIITGDFDLFEKTIHFQNDENSEDLKAFISKNTKVKLGEGKVTIGKINFLIEKSDDFDIVLNINSNTNISFECDEDIKAGLIPPIQVNRCNNVVFDFAPNSFSWPSDVKDGDFLIYFVDLTDSTLILGHENTPIKIESLSGLSKIIGKSSKVGVLGQISSPESQSLTLSIEKTIKEKCELELYEISLMSDITITLLQPDLSLLVTSMSNNDDSLEQNVDRLVRTQFYLGFDGFSSLQIKFIDNDVKINPIISVLLDIASSVSLNSPELDKFCQKNYTLIKISVDEGFDFTLDIIDPKPTTHGLTEEAFSVDQDKLTNSILFYTKVHPKNVPLLVCYNAKTQCEVKITKDQLIDISSIIPVGLNSVEVRVGEDISGDSTYLNFDLSVFKGINAEIRGENTNQVNVHLGQNRIETLTIDGVSLSDTSTSSFKVKKLIIVGSLINTVQGFDEIEVTDYSSWMAKQFDSFTGPISFTTISNEIEFESDGWKISDEKIKKDKFPNLKVNFQPSDKKLSFKKSTTGEIPVLKIQADPSINTFIVSKGWTDPKFSKTAKLNEIDGLYIENITDENKFTVLTSSFPFHIHPLNISQSKNQIIKFEEDIEITNDQISLKNTTLNIDNTNSKVTLNDVELIENTVINNTSPINVKRLITKDGNFSKINEVKISEKLQIYGESALEGQIEITEKTEIEFTWDLNETPEIIFTEFPSSSANVTVRFARDSLSKELIKNFNEFLFQKVFRLGNFGPICNSVNENLRFVSSVEYFEGENNVLESFCNDGELIIEGKRQIPSSEDESGKSKKKTTIILLSIFIPLVVVLAIVLSVISYRKGKCNKLPLQSELLQGEPSSVGTTPNYTENI